MNAPLNSGTMGVTDAYPNLRVPIPGQGEWIDFFVAHMGKKHCLYWRLNDGDKADPDTVEYGYISGHQSEKCARIKLQHLARCITFILGEHP